MKDIIKPLKAYITHHEIVVVTLSARKPTPNPPANADAAVFKKLVMELLQWGNDKFPFRTNDGRYWDGNRSQGHQDFDNLLFPPFPGDPLSKEDLIELADAVKVQRNVEEIVIVRLFMTIYLLEEAYFKAPATDETYKVMKEKDLNAFFDALQNDSIIDPNDVHYRAFKEALAPHLVVEHIIREGTSIQYKDGTTKRPSQRSSRRTRRHKNLFGSTATVQAEATKYDVAFLALVMYKELKQIKCDRRVLEGKKRESLMVKDEHEQKKVAGRAPSRLN
jgi:hypothetical protein